MSSTSRLTRSATYSGWKAGVVPPTSWRVGESQEPSKADSPRAAPTPSSPPSALGTKQDASAEQHAETKPADSSTNSSNAVEEKKQIDLQSVLSSIVNRLDRLESVMVQITGKTDLLLRNMEVLSRNEQLMAESVGSLRISLDQQLHTIKATLASVQTEIHTQGTSSASSPPETSKEPRVNPVHMEPLKRANSVPTVQADPEDEDDLEEEGESEDEENGAEEENHDKQRQDKKKKNRPIKSKPVFRRSLSVNALPRASTTRPKELERYFSSASLSNNTRPGSSNVSSSTPSSPLVHSGRAESAGYASSEDSTDETSGSGEGDEDQPCEGDAKPQDKPPSAGWVRAGFLHKKGGSRRNWRKRWFVLTPAAGETIGQLAYYKNAKELREPLGMIPLLPMTKLAMSTRRPFCFTLQVPNGRCYYLAARNKLEQDDWLTAILKAVRSGPGAPANPPAGPSALTAMDSAL